MKAQYANLVNHNRNRLEQVLPLSTPYALAIGVCDLCNFKCKFCAPQYSEEGRAFAKQMMDKSLFKKIVDDMTKFPEPFKIVRLASGEPLLNKDLPWMISYAKEKKVADKIEVITNGSLLNLKLNRQLVEAGLDRIRISIEGIDAEAYREMAGISLEWDKFLGNIKDLYEHRNQCEIYIKTVDAAVDTVEKQELFMDVFGNMADRIFVDHVIPNWADYEQIHDDFEIQRKEAIHGGLSYKELAICPFPFYYPHISATGLVTPCCVDWRHDIAVGDVSKNSLKDILEGRAYLDFLMNMLKKGRKASHILCARCDMPCYNPIDDIDKFRIQILRRFQEKYGD